MIRPSAIPLTLYAILYLENFSPSSKFVYDLQVTKRPKPESAALWRRVTIG